MISSTHSRMRCLRTWLFLCGKVQGTVPNLGARTYSEMSDKDLHLISVPVMIITELVSSI